MTNAPTVQIIEPGDPRHSNPLGQENLLRLIERVEMLEVQLNRLETLLRKNRYI